MWVQKEKEEAEEEDGQIGKIVLSYNFGQKWYFSECSMKTTDVCVFYLHCKQLMEVLCFCPVKCTFVYALYVYIWW